jgi:hypothetical protein
MCMSMMCRPIKENAMFNALDWYWLADDARTYGSKNGKIATDTDPDYTAWLDTNQIPTPWPRDEAGNQTNAALQEVLAPYGLFVDLYAYATAVRDKTLGAGITVNGQPFATDPITTMSLNSAFIYTQGKTGETFQWKLPDGSFVTLDKAGVAALQTCVAEYGQSCYQCESDTIMAIDAGTITTSAQVDAAFAAIPNSFTGTATAEVFKNRWQPRRR